MCKQTIKPGSLTLRLTLNGMFSVFMSRVFVTDRYGRLFLALWGEIMGDNSYILIPEVPHTRGYSKGKSYQFYNARNPYIY